MDPAVLDSLSSGGFLWGLIVIAWCLYLVGLSIWIPFALADMQRSLKAMAVHMGARKDPMLTIRVPPRVPKAPKAAS
jgi:hypothetical protein